MKGFDITIARVYGITLDKDTGYFLVDRLWPRGVRKQQLACVQWARDAAPSAGLRQWFHAGENTTAHWKAFVQRYQAELHARPEAWQPIIETNMKRPVVLLYAAHDTEHNHAVVLRDYLLTQRHRV